MTPPDILKSTTKAPNVDILRLNTLRHNNPQQVHHFFIGVTTPTSPPPFPRTYPSLPPKKKSSLSPKKGLLNKSQLLSLEFCIKYKQVRHCQTVTTVKKILANKEEGGEDMVKLRKRHQVCELAEL